MGQDAHTGDANTCLLWRGRLGSFPLLRTDAVPNLTMTRNQSAFGSKSGLACIERPTQSTESSDKTVSTVYALENSTVTVQETPHGPFARIERENNARRRVEWAGPLSLYTVAALEEVSL